MAEKRQAARSTAAGNNTKRAKAGANGASKQPTSRGADRRDAKAAATPPFTSARGGQGVKSLFPPVPPPTKVDYPLLEEGVQHWWDEQHILDKYLVRNAAAPERWSFVDGPITANNPMGVHHAWGRTYKDLWQRFNTMRGYRQRYQNGFDSQGLWVEVEVEKELGFTNKRQIEEYGIGAFVDKCKERVLRFSGVQTAQS